MIGVLSALHSKCGSIPRAERCLRCEYDLCESCLLGQDMKVGARIEVLSSFVQFASTGTSIDDDDFEAGEKGRTIEFT